MYASSEHYNQYMLQNNIIHINIHEKPYMMIQDDTYMRMHDDTKWYKRIQKQAGAELGQTQVKLVIIVEA